MRPRHSLGALPKYKVGLAVDRRAVAAISESADVHPQTPFFRAGAWGFQTALGVRALQWSCAPDFGAVVCEWA